MRILKIAAAVIATLVLCGAGCGSAPTAMVADRPVIANQPPPPSGVSMEFDRIVVFVPQGTKVGVESCGGVGIGAPISWKVGDKTLLLGAYRAAFNQELGTAGYNVDQRRSVFEDVERKSHADLIVGASIPEMSVNRCDPALYVAALGTMTLLMKKSADATITVDWEILDTLEHKVIFRTRTSGQGTATQGSVSIDVALQAAFQQAARNLARDPALRDALAKFKHPEEIASAVSGTPLATSTSEAPLARSRPSTTRLVIKRVPLSAKPFSEHVTDIRQQVVTISSKAGDGSGFFIAGDLLLTNHHVVAEDRFVKVRTLTGRELAGEVLASDPRRDIALIKTEKSGLTGLPIRQDEPGIGSQVFVIGTPGLDSLKRGALEGSVTSGIVSAYRDDDKLGRFIQSDVQVTHGNSGGPMFDEKGNVIGLTDLGAGKFVNLFIPVNDGLRALNVEIETPVALDMQGKVPH